MMIKPILLTLMLLACTATSASAAIVAQVGSRGFSSISNFENFDGGDFGVDPDFFFPADRFSVASASGFSFGYSAVDGPGYVVWPGTGDVGFGSRSLYQDGGAGAMATIALTDGSDIQQIELDVSNGFGPTDPANVWVRAYNNGVATGFDFIFSLASGATVSVWSNGSAFDELRIASYADSAVSGNEAQFSAVSFDNVTVGVGGTVPEPSSLVLAGLALLGLTAGSMKRSRRD
jgi:hypothetical protein